MYDVLESTLRAQQSRCFNGKNLTYKQILNIFGYKQILNIFGYSVGALFIRAYEQGERTYLAMVSRGYSENSKIQLHDGTIGLSEVVFLIFTIIISITLLVLQYNPL